MRPVAYCDLQETLEASGLKFAHKGAAAVGSRHEPAAAELFALIIRWRRLTAEQQAAWQGSPLPHRSAFVLLLLSASPCAVEAAWLDMC